MRPHRTRLSLTSLEDRTTPALFGQPWPDAGDLRVSFAPDGADVAGVKSDLHAALGARTPGPTWQAEFRRALQTWAQYANVNFRVVPDGGHPLGTGSPLQGGPGAGDIRVAARPLSGNVLAVTNPFDPFSPWAGEIVLNSDKAFSVGGGGGTYDLYTVLLQEVGHALGVGNSPDPAAAMYEYYGSPRTGLSAGDVAAVRGLYGVRQDDRYEGVGGNGSTARATPLTYAAGSTQVLAASVSPGSAPSVVTADLTRPGDVDVYRFTAPIDPGTPTAVLQVDTVSLLRGRLSLLDGSGKVVKSLAAAGPGGNAVLDLPGLAPGRTYFLRVEAATAGPFGVGGYRLAVGNDAPGLLAVAYSTWFDTAAGAAGYNLAEDAGGATSAGQVFGLGRTRPATDGRWDTYGYSTLWGAADADTFQINTGADAPPVLVAAVWTDGSPGLSPEVTVTNARGEVIPGVRLRSDGPTQLIQIEGAEPNTTYFVAVRAAQVPAGTAAARYHLGLDFRASPVALDRLASGTLIAGANSGTAGLAVTRSQLFRFELSAASPSGQSAAATLDVLDAAGAVVFSFRVEGGQTVVRDVLLAPGAYAVRVSGASGDGSALAGLEVGLRYLALTDPIGPNLLEPVRTTTSTTTTSAGAPATDPGYVWDPLYSYDPLRWWW